MRRFDWGNKLLETSHSTHCFDTTKFDLLVKVWLFPFYHFVIIWSNNRPMKWWSWGNLQFSHTVLRNFSWRQTFNVRRHPFLTFRSTSRKKSPQTLVGELMDQHLRMRSQKWAFPANKGVLYFRRCIFSKLGVFGRPIFTSFGIILKPFKVFEALSSADAQASQLEELEFFLERLCCLPPEQILQNSCLKIFRSKTCCRIIG